ncbi:MAG: S41 family peptidase [Clostridiales bacterium]|nr:S41 family peptidase [Clostridiales bacterium]
MKPFVKTIITVVITASVTFSGTSLLYAVSRGPVSGTADKVTRKLNAVNSYLKNNYLYDDYDEEKMSDDAVAAYVEALDEPYTHYYSSEEFDSYLSGVEDSYVGIGVVISVDEDSNKIVIIAPTEDSPAYEAGLLPGDYILAVDGTEYSGEQMDACVSAIKGGKEGTSVKVRIEHDGEQKEYDIKRRQISAKSVKTEMLEDNVGYVRITSFNTNEEGAEENTFTEFKEQVDSLSAQGMEKMVIDLRDNPGGVLDVVCDIADYLLPEGVITYTETKNGDKEEYRSDKNELNIPMAVLINGNSASASEILTGALKDYGRASVIGENSFGKGIVQSVYPFYDGSGMSMTIAKYYTPNGVCIHGVGIAPDYEVKLPEEYKDYYASSVPHQDDTQLQKALEILKNK